MYSFLIILLGCQLPDDISNVADETTIPLVPFAPGSVIPLESPNPLEITNEVLNHQALAIPNPILYQTVIQNSIMDTQNFVNQTQYIE